jgi:hypothetical protein
LTKKLKMHFTINVAYTIHSDEQIEPEQETCTGAQKGGGSCEALGVNPAKSGEQIQIGNNAPTDPSKAQRPSARRSLSMVTVEYSLSSFAP